MVLRTYSAIDSLELGSSEPYETWARQQLLDPSNTINLEALDLTRRLSARRRCYFRFWRPNDGAGEIPRAACPIGGEPLTPYNFGIFKQLLCEPHRIVLIAGDS